MRNVSIAALLPIFLFVTLVFINPQLLEIYEPVNIFWLFSVHLPLILSITVFFCGYVLLLWFVLKVEGFIAHRKEVKLETEVRDLKANLQDGQASLVERIRGSFEDILRKYKLDTEDTIKKLEKDNAKVLSDLEGEIKSMKQKVEKKK